MADYSSPKPIDPIDYRRGYFLRVTCGCRQRPVFADVSARPRF